VEVSVIESKTHSGRQATPAGASGEAPEASPGDGVRCILPGGEAGILPLRPIGRLFGALPHDGAPVTLEDMERAVVERACES
jgi:hypothetical protein